MNTTKGFYFQFPLCALVFGQTWDERLNAILDYSVVEAGAKLFHKLPPSQQWEYLQGKTGINPNDRRQYGACYGASVSGVTYGNKTSAILRHGALRDFVADFEARHGKDARVRLKMNLLFKARDKRGLTYREFAVLCAIYSVIGDKQSAKITQDTIRRRALGYRTAAILAAELPRRADKAQTLTERQLRDTIARLHRNKFFARCTYARRITYYSIRLLDDDLRKQVVKRHTYPDFFRQAQAAKDQLLTAEIGRKRRELAGSPPS